MRTGSRRPVNEAAAAARLRARLADWLVLHDMCRRAPPGVATRRRRRQWLAPRPPRGGVFCRRWGGSAVCKRRWMSSRGVRRPPGIAEAGGLRALGPRRLLPDRSAPRCQQQFPGQRFLFPMLAHPTPAPILIAGTDQSPPTIIPASPLCRLLSLGPTPPPPPSRAIGAGRPAGGPRPRAACWASRARPAPGRRRPSRNPPPAGAASAPAAVPGAPRVACWCEGRVFGYSSRSAPEGRRMPRRPSERARTTAQWGRCSEWMRRGRAPQVLPARRRPSPKPPRG